jgi:hypothetical protein
MASTIPLVPEYVYVIVRLKMSVEDHSCTPAVMVCHYGDTKDVLRVGGLVLPNETLVACALQPCIRLAWLHISIHKRIYLHHVCDGTSQQQHA